MTQAEEHEALVEACAERLASLHDAEWNYIRSVVGHPLAASLKAEARAVLAVLAEKAKEWPTEEMSRAGFRVNKFENKTADGEWGCPGVTCDVPAPDRWDERHAAQINKYLAAPKCRIARVTIPAEPAWRAMWSASPLVKPDPASEP